MVIYTSDTRPHLCFQSSELSRSFVISHSSAPPLRHSFPRRSCFALLAIRKLRGLSLCFTGRRTTFCYDYLTHETAFSTSFLLCSLLLPVWLVSPFLSYTARLICLAAAGQKRTVGLPVAPVFSSAATI